jgi:hypothetical protein
MISGMVRDDLRCAPELMHFLTQNVVLTDHVSQIFLALRLFSPPQGYNSGENKAVLVPRIVQLRVLLF